MKTAFAYRRVSGKGQLSGDGFERQRIAIEEYAVRNSIEIIGWYDEKGVSGTTEWSDRPAWNELIKALNGTRAIVIERLDRLARDLFVQEHILRQLRELGVELLSTAEEDIDSPDDPTRVLFRQILGAVAQFDRSLLVLKLRGARRRKKEHTGRCEGSKPFGWYANEGPALKRMLELHNGKRQPEDIAEALTSEGYLTRRDRRRWNPRVVRRILARHPHNS